MVGCRSLREWSLPSAWTLLPLRLVLGAGFLLHGMAKLNRGPANFALLLEHIGAPFPMFAAWMVTCVEILGGTLLIIGFLVAIVSVPLIVSMLVALFSLHIHYGFSSVNTLGVTQSGPVFGPPGYEINLLYIAGLIALALSHPTAISVDQMLFRQKTAPGATGRENPNEPARTI